MAISGPVCELHESACFAPSLLRSKGEGWGGVLLVQNPQSTNSSAPKPVPNSSQWRMVSATPRCSPHAIAPYLH